MRQLVSHGLGDIRNGRLLAGAGHHEHPGQGGCRARLRATTRWLVGSKSVERMQQSPALSATALRCSLTSLRLSLHFSMSPIFAAVGAKSFGKSASEGFLQVDATSTCRRWGKSQGDG